MGHVWGFVRVLHECVLDPQAGSDRMWKQETVRGQATAVKLTKWFTTGLCQFETVRGKNSHVNPKMLSRGVFPRNGT